MIKGAVSLVTGGASGLGKATVERLIQQGSRVVLCDLPTSKGKEVARSLGEDKVLFVPGNVTSEEDVKNVVSATRDTFGKLDNVINCAGIAGGMVTYNFRKNRAHSLEHFSKVIMVNAVGTFNVIRLAVGLIGENKADQHGCRGVVVNTASILGTDGNSGMVAYAASKAAVIGMTLPLARDLGNQGIRVVTIAPGYFETSMVSTEEDIIKSIMKMVLFPKRLGNPEEFARLVQSIIENPMLNGETIRLDGAVRVPPMN